jgi:hypothetical protein
MNDLKNMAIEYERKILSGEITIEKVMSYRLLGHTIPFLRHFWSGADAESKIFTVEGYADHCRYLIELYIENHNLFDPDYYSEDERRDAEALLSEILNYKAIHLTGLSDCSKTRSFKMSIVGRQDLSNEFIFKNLRHWTLENLVDLQKKGYIFSSAELDVLCGVALGPLTLDESHKVASFWRQLSSYKYLNCDIIEKYRDHMYWPAIFSSQSSELLTSSFIERYEYDLVTFATLSFERGNWKQHLTVGGQLAKNSRIPFTFKLRYMKRDGVIEKNFEEIEESEEIELLEYI